MAHPQQDGDSGDSRPQNPSPPALPAASEARSLSGAHSQRSRHTRRSYPSIEVSPAEEDSTRHSLLDAGPSREDLTSRSPSASPDKLPPTRHYTRMADKLGTWLVALVLSSLVLLAASVGFLSWIWLGDREDSRWRELMLGPDSALAITVTTFVVRLAIVGIAWVTTGMMASVIVEMHGVPEEKIADASVARYTGSILSLVLQVYPWKTSWFRVLIPLQVMCAVVSQLSSTLLLSDFDSATFPGFANDTVVAYDFSELAEDRDVDRSPVQFLADEWQRVLPASFEAFAEYSEPEGRILDDAVDDTGPVWRAFLPLVDRANANEYTGKARVVDARTVCVRPQISSVRVKWSGSAIQWVGRASINASHVPDLFDKDKTGFDVEFVCPLEGSEWIQCTPRAREEDGREAGGGPPTNSHVPHMIPSLDPLFYNRTAISYLDAEYHRRTFQEEEAVDGGRITPQTPAVEGHLPDGPLGRVLGTRTGEPHFLMDLRYEWYPSGMIYHIMEEYGSGSAETGYEVSLSIETSKGEGPWNIVEARVPSNTTSPPVYPSPIASVKGNAYKNETIGPVAIQATYCMDVMTNVNAPVPYLNITATSESAISEPTTFWSQEKSKYMTAEIRAQLGATKENHSLADRGILALTRESLHRAMEHEVKPADMTVGTSGDASTDRRAGRTQLTKQGPICISADCSPLRLGGSRPAATHNFWGNLFLDVLDDTGSPALAVQALNTAANRMLYMSWLGSFTKEDRAVTRPWVSVSVPIRVVGFGVVVAVVGVQVALLVVVGAMFRRCRNSVLNDAWLVVSQISSSPEALPELARGASITDREAESYVGKGRGRHVKRRRFAVRDGAFRRE